MEIKLIAVQTIEHFVSAKTATKAKKINQDFIQLGDGIFGILPEDWIEKFRALFQLGNVKNEDELQVPKFHYTHIDELYDNISKNDILQE